jgi:hypothetical protein
MRKSAIAGFCFLVVCAGTAGAQVPELINYQARLEIDGQFATTTGVDVVFRLYDMSSSGTLLYDETQTVDVVEGVYATDIGASNGVPGSLSAAIIGNSEVWLETDVDGQTLSPRERLVTVPYAMTAGTALTGGENPTNELNASLLLDVNTLKLTDAGGELSANLSGLIDDADASPTNELNTSVSFNSGNNQLSVTDAGGTLTADLSSLAGGGGGGGGVFIVKPSDQTNATTTLADDNDFVFSLQSGTYFMRGGLKLFGGGNEGNFGWSFTGTLGSLAYFIENDGPFTDFGATGEISVTSSESLRYFHGIITVTAGGDLTLRFARFEDNDGDGLTIRANSFMTFIKLN